MRNAFVEIAVRVSDPALFSRLIFSLGILVRRINLAPSFSLTISCSISTSIYRTTCWPLLAAVCSLPTGNLFVGVTNAWTVAQVLSRGDERCNFDFLRSVSSSSRKSARRTCYDLFPASGRGIVPKSRRNE